MFWYAMIYWQQSLYIYIYIHTHTHTHTHTIYVCVCVCVCMRACAFVHVFVHVCARMCVCVCVYICIYIYIYIYRKKVSSTQMSLRLGIIFSNLLTKIKIWNIKNDNFVSKDINIHQYNNKNYLIFIQIS
jgi:hypothetical protein